MNRCLSRVFLTFLTYSVLGWICETIFCSIEAGHFVKRGFLAGPYCPIYGVGALLMLTVGKPFAARPVLVFVATMLAAALVEYSTSWLLERLFHLHLWDYSHKKFQLHGRICLENTLFFGIMGLATLYIIQPRITRFLQAQNPRSLQAAALILFLVMVGDALYSMSKVHKLNYKLSHVHTLFHTLSSNKESSPWFHAQTLDEESMTALWKAYEKEPSHTGGQDTVEQINALTLPDRTASRLFRAYPHIRHRHRNAELEFLREKWAAKSQAPLP